MQQNKSTSYYQFKVIKHKGKLLCIREWCDGWLPINPISGVDIKSKISHHYYNENYHNS